MYRNSKQANLLFALELHRRCAASGAAVTAVAAHPERARPTCSPGNSSRPAAPARPRQQGRLRALLQSAAAGALSVLRAVDRSTPRRVRRAGPIRAAARPPEMLEISIAPPTGHGGAPRHSRRRRSIFRCPFIRLR